MQVVHIMHIVHIISRANKRIYYYYIMIQLISA